jgi:hypothetical protein
MGLFAGFFILYPSWVVVELIGNDSIPAFIDMDVPHDLLPWLMNFGQRLQRCPAVCLCLHRQSCIALACLKVLSDVHGCTAGKLAEHAVESNGLSG